MLILGWNVLENKFNPKLITNIVFLFMKLVPSASQRSLNLTAVAAVSGYTNSEASAAEGEADDAHHHLTKFSFCAIN